MNEIKISTQIKSDKEQKLTVKFDAKALGLDWKKEDTIRVKCYKKEGRLVLTKVARKYDRQIAYNVTSMGSGTFAHNLGIYVTRKNTRFNALTPTHMASAAVRMLTPSSIEVHLPKEVFASAS